MLDFELKDRDLFLTTFGDKHLQQIADPNLKQMITDHLLQNYNIKMTCTNKYFRAIDLSTDLDLNNLKKYKHLVYVNTNQNVYLIALVTFQNKNVCLLIDKQNSNFYLLKCQMSPSLYQGTIFEGEVIGHYFVISDFLVYLGKNISNHPLDRRINLLNSIISSKNYQYDPLLDPVQIVVKDFVDYSELASFIKDYLPTLPYKDRVSGLIFRPIENSNKNLIYNFNCHRNTTIFTSVSSTVDHPSNDKSDCDYTKQKINHDKHPEVTFMLYETGNPDDYILKLVNPKGQLFEYDYALINDIKTSQHFQRLLEKCSYETKTCGLPVVCKYLPTFHKWKPSHVIEGKMADKIVELL
jgi:hypothetical protein